MQMERGRLAVAVAIVAALCFAVPALASAGTWKFPPTLNAPWAQGGDDEYADSATLAAGLCRSSQFTTGNPYTPTTNVDVIFNDALNNTGASNRGCRTPQNETSVAVNPTNPKN